MADWEKAGDVRVSRIVSVDSSLFLGVLTKRVELDWKLGFDN